MNLYEDLMTVIDRHTQLLQDTSTQQADEIRRLKGVIIRANTSESQLINDLQRKERERRILQSRYDSERAAHCRTQQTAMQLQHDLMTAQSELSVTEETVRAYDRQLQEAVKTIHQRDDELRTMVSQLQDAARRLGVLQSGNENYHNLLSLIGANTFTQASYWINSHKPRHEPVETAPACGSLEIGSVGDKDAGPY